MSTLVHITLTNFLFESRLIKEVRTISKAKLFTNIYVLALHKEGLKTIEKIGQGIIVIRIPLKSRNMRVKFMPFTYLELIFRTFAILSRVGVTVASIHVIDLLPLGFLIKMFKNARVIYDAHELETHTSNNKYRIAIMTAIEYIFVRYVDLIIVVNDSIASIYRGKFKKKNIYSIYNAPSYIDGGSSNLLREGLGIGFDKVIFLYQGGLVEGRGIRHILDAFASISDTKHVIVFMGYGPLEEQITSYSEQYSNIFLSPAVSPEKLLYYTQSCDYGICMIENTCLSYFYCLPNKLLEYLMARKPVLVSNLPEMRRVVSDFNVGVISADFTPVEIVNAVEKMVLLGNSEFQSNIERAVKTLNWENQEAKLIEAYKGICVDL